MTPHRSILAAGALALLGAAGAAAQQPAAPPTATPLAVGADAPDFTLPASTKDGVSAKPVHLRDLRDKTVVIAFFYRARSSG
jgi:cytochrome oxidase Cu insertion factor (SCO1/SenC/PrrC family)